MTSKRTNNTEAIKGLIMTITILLMVLGIILGIRYLYLKPYNKACKDLGYEKSIDHNFNYDNGLLKCIKNNQTKIFTNCQTYNLLDDMNKVTGDIKVVCYNN